MVLRPPIARGLRFSQGAVRGQNMTKAVIGPTFFEGEMAFPGERHRPLLPKQQLPMPARQRPGKWANVTEAGRGHTHRAGASRPSASRRGGLHRVAPRELVSRVALSALSMPAVAAMDPHAPIGAGEDADLHSLTECANPERGNRLETDGAALRARHVQATPSPRLVRIGRADVRRLRRLERVDEQAGELLGRLAIEQHGDRSRRSPRSHAPTTRLPDGCSRSGICLSFRLLLTANLGRPSGILLVFRAPTLSPNRCSATAQTNERE